MDRNKNSKRQVRNEKYSSMNYNNLYDENLYKRMRLKSFREEERKKQRRKQKPDERNKIQKGLHDHLRRDKERYEQHYAYGVYA